MNILPCIAGLVLALSTATTLVDGASGPVFAPQPHCDGHDKRACADVLALAYWGPPVEADVLLDPWGGPQMGDDNDSTSPCSGPCPDLTVDLARLLPTLRYSTETFSSGDCNVVEGSTEAGTRDLLRFTTKVPNMGNGSLDIGDPDDNPEWFEWGDCHGHWHFKDFSAYRLWNTSTYAQWQLLRQSDPDRPAEELLDAHPGLRDGLVAGHKQGFCLIDVERTYFVAPPGPSHYPYCSDQGISPGWADVYGNGIDGQFLDVTDVDPGMYVLEIETNPMRTIMESDHTNNAAAVLIPVP